MPSPPLGVYMPLQIHALSFYMPLLPLYVPLNTASVWWVRMTMVQISSRVLPISQRPSPQRELPDSTLLNSCSRTCGKSIGEISHKWSFTYHGWGEFLLFHTSDILPPPPIHIAAATKIHNHHTPRRLAFPNSARQLWLSKRLLVITSEQTVLCAMSRTPRIIVG